DRRPGINVPSRVSEAGARLFHRAAKAATTAASRPLAQATEGATARLRRRCSATTEPGLARLVPGVAPAPNRRGDDCGPAATQETPLPMGLFAKLKGELVDIVEWIDDTNHTLVWRFPRYHNQIKNGARLIVRPGQTAVFVTEGRVADVFEPGTYELTTRNLPILSTLQGWKHGFDSPFKS